MGLTSPNFDAISACCFNQIICAQAVTCFLWNAKAWTFRCSLRLSFYVILRHAVDTFLYFLSCSGGDIFFTELYKLDEEGVAQWESDGGVSSYNPTVYETQLLSIPSGSSGR